MEIVTVWIAPLIITVVGGVLVELIKGRIGGATRVRRGASPVAVDDSITSQSNGQTAAVSSNVESARKWTMTKLMGIVLAISTFLFLLVTVLGSEEVAVIRPASLPFLSEILKFLLRVYILSLIWTTIAILLKKT